MIQVIGRVASVIKQLSTEEELTLAQLSAKGGLNHGTLCNILKSLIEVGWLAKNGRGQYRLSAEFRSLGVAREWNPEIIGFLNRKSGELSRRIRESVVISTLRYDRVAILSMASYQHTLMINDERFYARLSLYTSVSGEVLCAGLKKETRLALFRRCPLSEQDLEDCGGDVAGYEAKMERIYRAGNNVSSNEKLGIKSWALPVYDAEGGICACLGLSVPIVRLPEDEGAHILSELTSTRNAIAKWIANQGLLSGDFLRFPVTGKRD